MANLRLLVDEDFDNNIMRGVIRRVPTADLVRIQDVELSGRDDPTVLEWAASENRIVLTHDVNTMKRHAFDRVARRLGMPGLIAVPQSMPIGRAVEEIVLFIECSADGEWEGKSYTSRFEP